MSKYNIQTSISIFKELAEYIGLDSEFQIDAFYDQLQPSITIRLSKTINYLDLHIKDTSEFVDKIFKPVISSIENSDAVDNMKIELTSENNKLKEKQLKLEKEIKRLRSFEEYYNLALKMQHGEKWQKNLI